MVRITNKPGQGAAMPTEHTQVRVCACGVVGGGGVGGGLLGMQVHGLTQLLRG